MSPTPAKYLFDQDFAAPLTRVDARDSADAAHRISDAEARGYQKGYADAALDSARRNTAAVERIAEGIGQIAAGIAGIEARMETEAVDVALAVARKLCNELISREPLAETTALVTDCLRQLVAAPHLVIRINDRLYEAARETIEGLAKQSGFAGRMVLLAEPDIAVGDCRIEWADGGITSDRAATETKIAELVDRYLAARNTVAGG